MTLKEFLAENPEGKTEIDDLLNEALARGTSEERERLRTLDAISATVPAEMLAEAKYGKNPVDGPTLAYQAMVKGEKVAAAYMTSAIEDVKASGSMDVVIGTPDAGMEETDESDELADYINRAKGRK